MDFSLLLQHTRTWLRAAPVPFGSGKSIEGGIFPGRKGPFDFPTPNPSASFENSQVSVGSKVQTNTGKRREDEEGMEYDIYI